jgi:hypothetical protein
MSNTAQAPGQAKSKTSQQSTATTVNVMTIVDTDAITAVYPKNPKANKDTPTGLNHHEGIIMTCPIENFVGHINNDPANLEFSANVGDWIAFRAITVSANSEDAVILYYVASLDSTNVFNPKSFGPEKETRSGAVVPDTSTDDGLPALQETETFYSYNAMVGNKGQEKLGIRFALYQLDEHREKQELYDYFWFDPQIDVK